MRRRLRRRLDAETVALRIAHHGPGLFELPDAVRFRLDEMSTELEHSSQLRLAVGDVHVDVDRQLDRRRLRHPVEEEPGALPARIGRQPTVAPSGRLVVQQPSPELGEACRVVARERDVCKAQHGWILEPAGVPSERGATASRLADEGGRKAALVASACRREPSAARGHGRRGHRAGRRHAAVAPRAREVVRPSRARSTPRG